MERCRRREEEGEEGRMEKGEGIEKGGEEEVGWKRGDNGR